MVLHPGFHVPGLKSLLSSQGTIQLAYAKDSRKISGFRITALSGFCHTGFQDSVTWLESVSLLVIYIRDKGDEKVEKCNCIINSRRTFLSEFYFVYTCTIKQQSALINCLTLVKIS